MPEIELGSGTFVTGQGGDALTGGNLQDAAASLNPGDLARLKLTFPFPVAWAVGDQLAAVIGAVFAGAGQDFHGLDAEGDNTLVLSWTVR